MEKEYENMDLIYVIVWAMVNLIHIKVFLRNLVLVVWPRVRGCRLVSEDMP